jgi:hypothetical protein
MKKAQTSTLSLARPVAPAAADTAPVVPAATAEPAADEASIIAQAADSIDEARDVKERGAQAVEQLGDARQAWKGQAKEAAEEAASKVPLLGGAVNAYDAARGLSDMASTAKDAWQDPAKARAEAVAAFKADPTGCLKDGKDKARELKDLGEATAETCKAGWQGGKQVVQNVAAEGLSEGLKTTAKQAGTSVARQAGEVASATKGLVAKATGKAIAKEVAQEVAQVAVREGAEVAAKAGAKGLARFAPGVNVAMAAIDTAHAVSVCNNPDATGWQKGAACVTAAGSVLAATNIPVVSQVGAAVSIVASVAEHVNPAAAVDAVKGAASRVASWFGW